MIGPESLRSSRPAQVSPFTRAHFRWTTLLLTFIACAPAHAQVLSMILPRGAQRGTEAVVDFTGSGLENAQEVLCHRPGITATKLQQVSPTQVKVTLKIAPDCPLGTYPVHLRTARGISTMKLFSVGALQEIKEVEPNNAPSKAQKVPLNCTINGVADNEDVDYYAFDVPAAGTRVNAEIEGIRLGDTLFDPAIAFLDSQGRYLATADDTPLVRQDAVLSYTFSQPGTYLLQVHETSYSGNGNCYYRVHLGTFPRPQAMVPLGGKPGETIQVRWLGDSQFTQGTITLPKQSGIDLGVYPTVNNQVSPSPVPVHLSEFPNTLEVEPNDEPAKATPMVVPGAANGVIEKPGDVDWFRFEAKQGQTFDIRVYARSLRSALDSVLTVCNAAGGAIASNDDAMGPDSYVRVTFPANGIYTFSVRDHARDKGGPTYTYRIEVTPVQPKLSLGVVETLDRMYVPAGNRTAMMVNVARADFGGPVQLAAANLPPGVKMVTPPVSANESSVPVVFEADATAHPVGVLLDLTAQCTDPKQPVSGRFAKNVKLVNYQNNTTFFGQDIDRMPFAVAAAAPFKIQIVPPKVPLVRDGSMMLKVIAERTASFKDAIELGLLYNPPGIGSGRVTIPVGQNEAAIPINANGSAPAGTFKIVAIGSSAGYELSSQLADLTVSDRWVQFALEKARTEQGQPTEIFVKVTKNQDFTGEAVTQLLGLPKFVTSAPAKITKDTKELKFALKVEPTAPVGKHTTVFVQSVIVANGEPIVHNSGGGELTIDQPIPKPAAQPPAAKPAPAPAVAAAPAKPPEKRLSRREQLRLEREQAAGKPAAPTALPPAKK